MTSPRGSAPDEEDLVTPFAVVDEQTFEAGLLTLRASSTAWATTLTLESPRLLRRLAEELGEAVVVEVRVLGPGGPGFGRGRRSVPGRGARDTWG